MPGWTLVDTHPSQGRTFQRPLDPAERAFLWDSHFDGIADAAKQYKLRLSNIDQDANLFSEANIVKAWISTKRRFPLAGATVQGLLGEADPSNANGSDSDGHVTYLLNSNPHFVVREHDLAVLRPHEIVFGEVTCLQDVQDRIDAIWNEGRVLSEDVLVQLHVYRETDPHVLHLVLFVAHYVADMLADETLGRCLLDTLARGGDSNWEPAQMPLEERLAMAVPMVDRAPEHLRSLSVAKRRWRMAIGAVIYQLMVAKRQGGQTLPCRITRSTPLTPAKTGFISTLLTDTQTATVLANCRVHGLTFGIAHLPLAQVATTRVLYRRYLRGEISEQEWTYRKRQPYLTAGPINLRPRLDKTWFDRGGGGEFVLSMGPFFHHLPFMTLGTTAPSSRDQNPVLQHGAPPCSDLLTFDRFLHRARLLKKQAATFYNHPLFFEIVCAYARACDTNGLRGALAWLKVRKTQVHSDDEVLAVTDLPLVRTHIGSSYGDVDLITPTAFPLPATHPLSPGASVPHPLRAGYVTDPSLSSSPAVDVAGVPTIKLENSMLHLHTRPTELYLGASSSRGQLSLFVHYDRNVYEDTVVKEWLEEVKGAVLWYLGRTHQPHRARQGRLRGSGQAGLWDGVSATSKL
ncbi:hypothetical protein JVU11DRAFT_3893 [Chiua virens]|nr:hypothetical protein JVU11DRAFT_3893 [Chiua virens]